MANSKFKFQISKTVHNNTWLVKKESSKCEPKWRSTMFPQSRMNDPLTIMLQIWNRMKSISIVVSMVSLSPLLFPWCLSLSIVVSMVSLSPLLFPWCLSLSPLLFPWCLSLLTQLQAEPTQEGEASKKVGSNAIVTNILPRYQNSILIANLKAPTTSQNIIVFQK